MLIVRERTISEVVEELRPQLAGRVWGKVFQLSRNSLAVDLRTGGGRYLFISAEPARPRLHLIGRTVRELEKGSLPPTPFALVLRKALGGGGLDDITKDDGDRVVRLRFLVRDEVGRERRPTLVAQLTGRSANLFLLDDEGHVIDSLRPARGAGQAPGEPYSPPASLQHGAEKDERAEATVRSEAEVTRGDFASLSEALDDHYLREEREQSFGSRAAAHEARIRQAVEKRRKLLRNLGQDLARHGDAEAHKRAGDLLLANVVTAEREGDRVRVFDYYAEGAPIIELEIGENKTLQEEATHRFGLYSKARRAAEEIARRISQVNDEIAALEVRRAELARVVAERDLSALEEFDEGSGKGRARAIGKREGARARKKSDEGYGGARRYRSTDGHEILVGRTSRDNDQITFRVARSYDLWLHAADYPGSHVVVRNPKKGEPVPHRTLVEAAQLAAHFSQARKDAKVAVNYTERKFVSKIKGGAPGLVRLAGFRTIMVEPRADLERI